MVRYKRSVYSDIINNITIDLMKLDDSILILEIDKIIPSTEIDFSNNHNLDRKKLQTRFRTWLSKKYGKGVYEANILKLEYIDQNDTYECIYTIRVTENHRKFIWGSISNVNHEMEKWFE